MTNKEFEVVVKNCIGSIQKVLGNKAKEYASKEDRLHNFNKAKDLMRCKTREYALLGMLNKHLVSVIDIVMNYENFNAVPTKEVLEEKIGDTINYMILLKACFLEDAYSKAKKEE